MSHYRRRMPATAISPHVKPTENNPKKYQAFNFVKSAEDNAFSTSAKRFSKDHYFLEDGGPGGNHLLNPQVVSRMSKYVLIVPKLRVCGAESCDDRSPR